MENGSFEDVFPIENGDIPASYVSLPEGKLTDQLDYLMISGEIFGWGARMSRTGSERING